MNNFITIKEETTSQIVEKKSKFITYLYYVETLEEIDDIIKKIRKKHFDAKHCCSAYRIIEDEKVIEKANDDGEPTGTAGIPMLGILKNKNLCNILVIVVRYFGGILLGTGGLVKAYSSGLQNTLEKANLVEKCLGEEIQVEIEYSQFEKFKYYCEKSKINIVSTLYKENIVIIIEIKKGKQEEILSYFNSKNINIKNYKNLRKKFITRIL